MSIMGMRRKFAKHLKIIMWIIVAVFVIGIPLGIFYSSRMPMGEEGQGAGKVNDDEVLALVGATPLTRGQLNYAYQTILDQTTKYSGQKVTLTQVLKLRNQAMNELAANLAVETAAQKAGVTISRDEVKQSLAQENKRLVEQLKEYAALQKQDPREIYRLFMAKQGTVRSKVSEDDFINWLEKQDFAGQKAFFERSLLRDKYQKSVSSQVQISDADLAAAYDEAKLRLIFVSQDKPVRSEAEAKKRAEEIYRRLQQGADFGALAKSDSDASPNLVKSWISRKDLGSTLGEAAAQALFALKPGAYTAPIKLPKSFILMQLLERRSNLPADFAQKKEDYKKRLLATRQQEAWDKARQEAIAKSPFKPKDPELIALRNLQAGKQKEASAAFEKALDEVGGLMPGEVFSAIYVTLAGEAFQAKDYAKAQKELDNALAPAQQFNQDLVSGFPERIYLLLGQLALEQGNKQVALDNFSQADNNANENPAIHQALKQIYDKMGEKEKAKEQNQWLQEFAKYQQQMQQQAGAGPKPDATNGAAKGSPPPTTQK
jgi:parvulin-like peptidyl-prolyl isomerase